MTDTSDNNQLRQAIIRMSKADTWEEAKQEWSLTGVVYMEEGNCLCGKHIKEHCFIRNELTFNETHVGNECIKHFTGVIAQADHTKEIFQVLKKLKSAIRDHPGGRLAKLAIKNGWARPSEVPFLTTTEKRRNLSASQRSWLSDINRRIIDGLSNEPWKYEPKPKRDGERVYSATADVINSQGETWTGVVTARTSKDAAAKALKECLAEYEEKYTDRDIESPAHYLYYTDMLVVRLTDSARGTKTVWCLSADGTVTR